MASNGVIIVSHYSKFAAHSGVLMWLRARLEANFLVTLMLGGNLELLGSLWSLEGKLCIN